MLHKVLFAILLSLSANVFAYQFPLEIIEKFDDARLVVFVKESDIKNTPGWSPSRGAPPLTIAQVVTRVNEWCDKDKTFRHSVIQKIELKPIKQHEKQNRWYYLVQLRTPKNGQHPIQYLAVLMDGKVIPAIREPSSIK